MLSTTTILGLVAGLAALASAAPSEMAAPPVPQRGPYAGGVNMEDACHQQYGSEWTPIKGKSAYDWTCELPRTGQTGSLDVNGYCERTYHNGAYGDPQGGGPYDWGCYFP